MFCVRVCRREASDHSGIVLTRPMAWAVGAADPSGLQWGTAEQAQTAPVPPDQPVSLGGAAENPGAGAVHSPWNSSWPQLFLRWPALSFQPLQGRRRRKMGRHRPRVLMGDCTQVPNLPGEPAPRTHCVSSLVGRAQSTQRRVRATLSHGGQASGPPPRETGR